MTTGVGDVLRLEVGPVAHGGHCVARHEGRVVFVRHALPGEVVRARVTEAGEDRRHWRADAVDVLHAAPDRVQPPCALAGPGLCGGCDWQHVTPAGQRRLKAAVVTEQLRRLAGIDLAAAGLPDLQVEAVAGDESGLGWRTRVRFGVDELGRPGFHPHRSHALLPVQTCPIAHPDVNGLGVGRRAWPGSTAVEVAVPTRRHPDLSPDAESDSLSRGTPLVIVDGPLPRTAPRLDAPSALARRGPSGLTRVRGRTWLSEEVLIDGVPRSFRVTGSGFWQVHPGAAQALLDAVLDAARPEPGDRVADLYSGVGLFAAGMAMRVRPLGAVVAVESDARAVADARRSLHDLPEVRVVRDRVVSALAAVASPRGPLGGAPDIVVLDPPRSGAGAAVISAVAALAPRVVVYVACDPAALARDLSTAIASGYRLSGLRAFDLFPMTHHVECLATLVRT